MKPLNPQLTGLHLVPPLQLALGGIGKCWPAQGPRAFYLEGFKELTLVYRLALHQRVEILGMTFVQSCMRSVSANYAITDKFLESPATVMGPGREQAGLSDWVYPLFSEGKWLQGLKVLGLMEGGCTS